MTPLDDAIDKRLTEDPELTNLLAQFRGAPAVFLSTPLPEGVTLPYVAVGGIVGQVAHEAKREAGRKILRDVNCYTLANGDTATVDAIAERIWWLFHKTPLTIDGWENNVITATGPMEAPTDKTMYGRVVTLELTIWKL
jgi:hypothetical protein